jgi:hypothetical protein
VKRNTSACTLANIITEFLQKKISIGDAEKVLPAFFFYSSVSLLRAVGLRVIRTKCNYSEFSNSQINRSRAADAVLRIGLGIGQPKAIIVDVRVGRRRGQNETK